MATEQIQNEDEAAKAISSFIVRDLLSDPAGESLNDAEDATTLSEKANDFINEPNNSTADANLESWLSAHPEDHEAFLELQDRTALGKGLEKFSAAAALEDEARHNVWDQIQSSSSKAHWHIYFLAGAAACIILLVGIWLLWLHPSSSHLPNLPMANRHDIEPGSNRAILTLADGRQITLENAKNGTLAEQGTTKIQKGSSGQIAYVSAGRDLAAIGSNTLSTPLGGQFRLILPDGSMVWLNAGSSIRYPTAFTGPTREVTLSGEAYFDIVHHSDKPFIINSTRQKIEVLGTILDVMTYENEPIVSTTLLRGAVRISANNNAIPQSLKPGQQSQLNPTGALRVINEVDTESVVAWKNEIFEFNYTDLPSIMRQVSRWYNVDVVYDGPISTDSFNAYISRNLPVSKVLDLLSQTGKVQFIIDGRTIHVKKQVNK